MSYNQVRRKDKQMSKEEMIEFIRTETIAHLCMIGPNNFPYVIPLNYAFVNGKFILHSAMKGLKVDCLNLDNRVCLTVSKQHSIKTDGRIPCKEFKTPYTSIIAFGRAAMPKGEAKINYLTDFVKYNMKNDSPPVTEFDKSFMLKTLVIVVDVLHMTGKSSNKEV